MLASENDVDRMETEVINVNIPALTNRKFKMILCLSTKDGNTTEFRWNLTTLIANDIYMAHACVSLPYSVTELLISADTESPGLYV